jgi:hypothetical protein
MDKIDLATSKNNLVKLRIYTLFLLRKKSCLKIFNGRALFLRFLRKNNARPKKSP